eukprot:587452-Hanusia_phi.AAC.2
MHGAGRGGKSAGGSRIAGPVAHFVREIEIFVLLQPLHALQGVLCNLLDNLLQAEVLAHLAWTRSDQHACTSLLPRWSLMVVSISIIMITIKITIIITT